MTDQPAENELPLDDEEEFDEPEIVIGKYIMDGATTLAEAATMLREVADQLDQKHGEGWTLRQPVDGGWVILNEPESATS
jgi:hypothetical protein